MYYKMSSNICPYENYYRHQAGSGVGIIYKGVAHQRGHGIGSFLGGLFRSVLPLLSNGAKVLGKEALNAGMGLLSDMATSKPLDDSFRNRFKEATSNLKRKADAKIDQVMSGSGYKTKRQRLQGLSHSRILKRRTVKKAKQIKNINYNDIFSES